MRRQAVVGECHHPATPAGGVPDRPDESGFGRGVALADVVDAAGRAVVGDRQGDRGGNVLDEAARPAPAGLGFAEEDGGPAVADPLRVVLR
jgi:hypothetical protein